MDCHPAFAIILYKALYRESARAREYDSNRVEGEGRWTVDDTSNVARDEQHARASAFG